MAQQRRGGFKRRKKVDYIAANKIEYVDYKDTELLSRFVSERGKILPRRVTGTSAKNQRKVTTAIKRARVMALMPFVMSVKCYTDHKEAETMRDVKEVEVRRAEIMSAALQLFAQKGYLKTRTQDIIDKLGISRGLLYYHFKDKEDILYCLIEKNSEPLLRKLEKISYQPNVGAKEKIRAFIEATLIPEESRTQENQVLQETVNLETNRYVLDRFYHRLCERMIVFFTHILEEGQKSGDFHLKYSHETASFLMTAYVFVSNDIKMSQEKPETFQYYLTSFQAILERSLGLEESIF